MKWWFVLLILVLPVVYAERFDEFKDITLNFEIQSGIQIISEQGVRLDFLEAHLKLVPFKDERQNVLNLDIFSQPEAIIKSEEGIRYRWNELHSTYSYGLKSKIRVFNNIAKITSQIPFPQHLGSEFDEYLSGTEFIDITIEIRDKANELVEGETDYYRVVYTIAEWTRNNIEYDLNTLTAKAVKKSSWVLEYKQGVCDELTNLFISLLRSVGIPARFVTGTVYTSLENGWGNHGWAEVYFPGKGWLPWDVTYGQYGWIDPSHLKLSESTDSGESSVDYTWRSNRVTVLPDPLELTTQIDQKGGLFEPLVKLQIEPFAHTLAFGSYLPLIVTVENLKDYYVTDTIILTKGPYVENNVKHILLKPKEITSVYFIGKVPEKLDEKLRYTSVLEVIDSFLSLSKNEVFYSTDGRKIDLTEAGRIVYDLEKRETKEVFRDVSIQCEFEKRAYTSDETIAIVCTVVNVGTIHLENLHICLDAQCIYDSLGIGEGKEFSFSLPAKESALFLVENEDFIKEENVKFSVVYVPHVYLSDIHPVRVDYNVEMTMSFYVHSDFEVRDVHLTIDDMSEISLDSLQGKQFIEFTTNSKKFVSGLNVKMRYKDVWGREYYDEKTYPILITRVPFYVRWWYSLF